jgi:hypothetical protein
MDVVSVRAKRTSLIDGRNTLLNYSGAPSGFLDGKKRNGISDFSLTRQNRGPTTMSGPTPT